AEGKVQQNRPDRADRHRLLAAEPVRQQSVRERSDHVPEVAAGAHPARLLVRQAELPCDLGRNGAQVVTAQVEAGVKEPEKEPVPKAAQPESARMLNDQSVLSAAGRRRVV